jgi:hypothetical protein
MGTKGAGMGFGALVVATVLTLIAVLHASSIQVGNIENDVNTPLRTVMGDKQLLGPSPAGRGCEWLFYYCNSTYYWSVPNTFSTDDYGMRFTPAGCCTLTTMLLYLYDSYPEFANVSGSGIDLSIYDDDGFGLPGELLETVNVPGADLDFYPSPVEVDLSELNLVFCNDFHVVFTVVDQESDNIAILSDDGTCGELRSTAVFFGDYFTMSELFGDDVNFLMSAQVCYASGNTCDDPIVIDSLPFRLSFDTGSYDDSIMPDPETCETDEFFGVGPDVIFEYTPAVNETLVVQFTPFGDWDPVLYAVSPCDPYSCLITRDDYGEGNYEVFTIEVDAGIPCSFVVDGDSGSTGEGEITLYDILIPLCWQIEIPDDNDLRRTGRDLTSENGGYGRSRLRISHSPAEWQNCEKGWRIIYGGPPAGAVNQDRAGICSAHTHGADRRNRDELAVGESKVTIEGQYVVWPKSAGPKQDELFVECALIERIIRGEMKLEIGENYNPQDEMPKCSLEYKRSIPPFRDGTGDDIYHPSGTTDGVYTPSGDEPYEIPIEEESSTNSMVQLGKIYDIKLELGTRAEATPFTYARASIDEIDFRISCPDPPDDSFGYLSDEYEVHADVTSITFEPIYRSFDNDLTVAAGFGQSTVLTDSTVFQRGGLVYSYIPSFGDSLFTASRINVLSYVDSISDSVRYAPDSSFLFTVSGSTADTFVTSEALSAPADLIFDNTGNFGNKIYATHATLFGDGGIADTGGHKIVSIDHLGALSTFAENLNSPVGMVIAAGTPLGNNMYVAEQQIGKIVAIDPLGSQSVFASGLSMPRDIVVGTGSFGNCLYVVEYDTTRLEGMSSSNGGKIIRVDSSGAWSTFVDALQNPTDLEFGPGGDFGTDLYVLLDNSYAPSGGFVPGSGKIVTIDDAGVVTEFASGLDAPSHMTFDTSGVLYVSAGIDILKIFASNCGDADGSGGGDIDDVVYLITYIFAGGPPPIPYEAGDVNCSGAVDIDDVVYIINWIFQNGPPPCDPDDDGILDC